MTDRSSINSTSATLAITRRQVLAGTALGLAGMYFADTSAVGQEMHNAPAKPGEVTDAKAIHQEVDFTVPPKRICEALLDSKQFTEFSGGRKAEIDRAVGGAFNIFAGVIEGRNLELLPNQRIVQAWRVTYWPKGIYSIARFELSEQGTGTRIIFDHTGFPAKAAETLASGWYENYWDALKKYFN